MTARVDLREFLSAYLAEVDEQLRTANGKLLQLEALARRGEADPRLVRDLFRALHTIKGLSAMVGVEPAVNIAHRLETVLRSAVEAGGRLPLPWFDLLLRSVRAIEQRAQELAEGKPATPAPAALLSALDALDDPRRDPASGSVLALEASLLAKLASYEVDVLANSAKEGKRAVRIDFSPSPQKAERGLTINGVRERLSALGDVVKVLPISVPPTAAAPGALTFAILLATGASNAELSAAAGDGDVVVVSLSASAAPEPLLLPLPEIDDVALDLPMEEASPQRQVVRVHVSRLDEAMECLSSLIVTRSRLLHAIGELAQKGVGTRDLTEVMRDNTRQLRDLRSAILRVRMVRVAEVLERLPLVLRGLRKDGKDVSLAIDAGDSELDKAVAERLFPALVHLVRNAVDHAIETPDERVRAGKPPGGTVQIVCSTESSTRLELRVIDDGRGIDRDRLARRLRHDVPAGGAGLLDVLCRPGLSTQDEATTTSGRGMGMDIVRRTVVAQLGGELSLTTVPGHGTTFSIKVPLTVMIVDAFSFECCGQRFVVPVSMVEEVLEIDRTKVSYGPSAGGNKREDGTGVIERRGEAVPLVPLASALGLSGERRFPRQALLVRRSGEPIAFGVDRVVTQLEAVVRPLIDVLVASPGVSGATDLGDGKPTLVLDLVALGALLASRESRAA